MIFTYGYFEKSKLQKYFTGVATLMKACSNSEFFDDDAMEILHSMLKKLLERDKPKDSQAYVELHRGLGGDGGCIYVFKDKYCDGGAVLRLIFQKVANVFKYDRQTERFVYVGSGLLLREGGEA